MENGDNYSGVGGKEADCPYRLVGHEGTVSCLHDIRTGARPCTFSLKGLADEVSESKSLNRDEDILKHGT